MPSLYALVNTKEPEKRDLYIKGADRTEKDALLAMKKGDTADFATYFNSFSVKKWKRYTTIQNVTLQLEGEGEFEITTEEISSRGTVRKQSFSMRGGTFSRTFSMDELTGDILGFSVRCESDTGNIIRGEWLGEFDEWKEIRIGVSITTFKREAYVQKTMAVLRDFRQKHDWLDILVVDNGRTLEPRDETGFRIVPNRNFGGSGGFTRGMIEYVEKGNVDYVLLMDDDIVLEPSAVERTRSLLCGLKAGCQESFLAGAMLQLEHPTFQYENTACWRKIRLYSKGKDYDLTNKERLVGNEEIPKSKNRYGAWWYCAVPVSRIRAIGYPLPFFIKGDDMEYGIRNHREVMSLNGIGVWHQSFETKLSPLVYYFSDRNMLIMNHYADGCNRWTFIVSLLGRVLKRRIKGNTMGLFSLLQAVRDYNSGMTGMTAIPSDKKMETVSQVLSQPIPANLYSTLWKEIWKAISHYRQAHDGFVRFRSEKLKDSAFWKTFMM